MRSTSNILGCTAAILQLSFVEKARSLTQSFGFLFCCSTATGDHETCLAMRSLTDVDSQWLPHICTLPIKRNVNLFARFVPLPAKSPMSRAGGDCPRRPSSCCFLTSSPSALLILLSPCSLYALFSQRLPITHPNQGKPLQPQPCKSMPNSADGQSADRVRTRADEAAASHTTPHLTELVEMCEQVQTLHDKPSLTPSEQKALKELTDEIREFMELQEFLHRHRVILPTTPAFPVSNTDHCPSSASSSTRSARSSKTISSSSSLCRTPLRAPSTNACLKNPRNKHRRTCKSLRISWEHIVRRFRKACNASAQVTQARR